MADGYLNFDTKINTSGFTKGVKGLTDAVKKLGAAFGVVFGVQQLVKFAKASVDLASDIQEVQNVVDTAFGDMSYKMEQFAKTAIETYGISELTAKKTGSTFAAMASGTDVAIDSASDMAVALTGLSADMASFYNVSQETAAIALYSVFTGETETLKKFGVVMTEVNLQAFALSKGITKSFRAMSQAEKVQLRYEYVMAQTALAHGDFAKTSDNWANQTRMLSERWKELSSIVGTGIMNTLAPGLRLLNSLLSSTISSAEVAYATLAKIFGWETDIAAETATVTDNISDSVSEQEALTDAIEATKKQLAGFDEINQLSFGEGDTAASNGASGAITPIVNTTEQSAAASESALAIVARFREAYSTAKKIWGRASDIFKQSFSLRLETGGVDSAINRFKTAAGSISTSLFSIFTDPAILKGAVQMSDQLIATLGSVAGNYVSVGSNFAAMIMDGIGTALKEKKRYLERYLISLYSSIGDSFNSVSDITGSITDIINSLLNLKSTSEIVSDYANIYISSIMSGLDVAAQLIRDNLTRISNLFRDNKDGIIMIGTDILSVFSTISGTVSIFVESIGEKLRNTYATYFKPAIDNLWNAVSDMATKLVGLWEQYVSPFLSKFGTEVSDLINNHVAPMWDKAMTFFGKLAVAISELYENVIEPVAMVFVSKIVPLLVAYIGTLWNFVKTYVKNFVAIMGNIFSILGSLIDFITSVFTGDWKGAWKAVCDIFDSAVGTIKKIFSNIVSFFQDEAETLSGVFADLKDEIILKFAVLTGFFSDIWTGISDGAKAKINLIIGYFNGLLSVVESSANYIANALNGISYDIPDWVPGIGGSQFGFNIPQISIPRIPKLATGTVVPANYGEFLAVLGDNKRETEIVSPLSTIKQAVSETISDNGALGSEEVVRLLRMILASVQSIDLQPSVSVREVGQASSSFAHNKAVRV